MTREIWALSGNRKTYLIQENGENREILRDSEGEAAGNIYFGKVNRIMGNLKACFVDFGADRDGFLPLEENSRSFIGNPIRSGMKIAVQIRKEAHGEKGAFLSRDISIPGEYLILMPMNRHIGVSVRVTDPEKRTRLFESGRELSNGQYGIVMRSSSVETDPALLYREWERLKAEWADIEKRIASVSASGAVFESNSVLDDLIRDYSPRGIDAIRTDDLAIYRQYRAQFPCVLCERAQIEPAFKAAKKEALQRVVHMKHGGSIYIDRCEAMTVIDVNTASDIRCAKGKNGMQQTNLDACDEIAKQIRLRNLSGIILIDMIDPETETDQSLILEKLREHFMEDRIKTVVHGITGLGLVEMTRKRSGLTVYDQWSRLCEKCDGSGIILQEDI